MNNQSEKPEKLRPQDSDRKDIKHPKDDNEAVVKSEDKQYHKDEAEFKNVAKSRENSEQPVNPIKQAPKE